MYKIAVADELESGVLKEIKLSDFKMQHDFDFIWEKDSIYTDKYVEICKELSISMHIPQELRIRSRGTERHSASN